ncbi:MAG: 2Fe-2S iron-sulfur cluster-binding protein, partial [Dongiaceae bacterium]
MTDTIKFILDGREVEAAPGETIWQVADRLGNRIPHLCWSTQAGYRADGNCRACMVEVEGERVLAASCIRKPTPDMVVKTATDRAVKARRMVMELLLADQPPREDSPDRVSPFWHWAEAQRIETSRFPAHGIIKPDLSHPAMAVNLDACIDCGLCVRACREVHSVCPYCGVGCQLTYQIKDEKIAFVQGSNGYSNENRLCVKGRFGFDYVTNPQRLMKPLIRKPGLPKGVNVDPANPYTHFRQASWEEALDFAAAGLAKVA